MFIELVDSLRCPNPHEESWLVMAAERMEARHVLEGTLGCHVCGAQFPVRRGISDLRLDAGAPRQDSGAGVAPEDPMRLAALLGLVLEGTNGFALLEGSRARVAAALGALVEMPIICVNPPPALVAMPGLSLILAGDAMPLAAGAARAAAVATPGALASAVHCTRAGGRIVAPVGQAVPAGVRELARDERDWVAEVESRPSAPVTLHVRRGR